MPAVAADAVKALLYKVYCHEGAKRQRIKIHLYSRMNFSSGFFVCKRLKTKLSITDLISKRFFVNLSAICDFVAQRQTT